MLTLSLLLGLTLYVISPDASDVTDPSVDPAEALHPLSALTPVVTAAALAAVLRNSLLSIFLFMAIILYVLRVLRYGWR